VWVVYEDDRNGMRDIYLNFSLDHGETYQPIELRIDSDTAGAAESTSPVVAVTDEGAVIAWIDQRNVWLDIGDLYARTVE